MVQLFSSRVMFWKRNGLYLVSTTVSQQSIAYRKKEQFLLVLKRLLFVYIKQSLSICQKQIEPRQEKTCVRCFQQGRTQTGL